MTPKSYPLYRESGVEWVRTLPESWKISALKRNSYIKGRVGWKGLTSEEFEDASDAYLVTGTDFRGRYIDWKSCYQVNKARFEDDPFIQLRNGDLLITKDGTIGKTSLVDGLDKPACLNSGIFLVRPAADYVTEFLYWVLNSTVFEHFVDLTSSGSTIQHLYQNVFENFIFGFPDVEVQRQIADYLDTHTAKIDTLIGKQERLIEMLAERRQAVISHAVTNGLDPNVSMKDSGVEWLSAIPDTWTVPCVAHHFSIVLGKMVNAGKVNEPGLFDAPYLRAGNVQPYGVDITEAKTMPMSAMELTQLSLRIGDLVVVEGGQGGYGRSALVLADLSGWGYQNHVMRVRPKSCESNAFLDYVIKTLRAAGYIASLSSHASLPSFSAEKLAAIRYGRPPASEQGAIVEYLDHETTKIDALAAKAREMIGVLKERRQALIRAAVTGKIDVRGLS